MSSHELPILQYPDLAQEEIRLVNLHAGTDDTLNCSLRTADPHAPPPYEALSYAWGDGARTEVLTCDGAALYVTHSLYTALQQLRGEGESRTLWVDQICMDQGSPSEKSAQISKMALIFKNAQCVLVWLGEEDSTTDFAFQSIRTLALRTVTLSREGQLEQSGPGRYTQRTISNLQLTPNTAPEWVAYRSLLARPWFSRVWIYEEIALAKKARILCGRTSITWAEFLTAYGTLMTVSSSLPNHQSYIIGHQGILQLIPFYGWSANETLNPRASSLIQRYKTSHDLLNLVKVLRRNSTTKAMDRIYGALGVAMDLDDRTPKVDVSADVRNIFCDYTKWFIHRYSDLSVLKLVDTNGKFDKERQDSKSLPSWTPNYHHYDYMNNLLVEHGPRILPHGSARLYNATGAFKSHVVNETTFELRLKGIRIGKIVETSEPAQNLTGNTAIGPRVLTGGEWFQLAATYFADGIYKHTNEPLAFAYARTRMGDHMPNEQTISDRHVRIGAMKAQGHPTILLEPGEVTFDVALDGIIHMSNSELGASIIRHTTRRRLYITDTGYMGTCHRSCRKDDDVYLLMGGDMPFVLRRLDPKYFGFKGESYVHGVMDGELLLNAKKQTSVSEQSTHGFEVGSVDDDVSSLQTEDIILI